MIPEHANAIYRFLFSLDPKLPWALLSIVTGWVLRTTRRLFPKQASVIPVHWDLIPAALAPAALVGMTFDASSLALFAAAVLGVLDPLLRMTPPSSVPAPPTSKPPALPVEFIRPPPLDDESADKAPRSLRSIRAVPLGVLVLVVCLSACSGRQTCLAEAEIAADERADEECHDKGIDWDSCPSRRPIMQELKAEQRKCD